LNVPPEIAADLGGVAGSAGVASGAEPAGGDIPDGALVTLLDSGNNHIIAVIAGRLLSWGDNSFGQRNLPEDVREVNTIAAGGAHTLISRELIDLAVVEQALEHRVDLGSQAELTVDIVGEPPFGFQWFVGESGDESQMIEGATDQILTLNSVLDKSFFWVRITSDDRIPPQTTDSGSTLVIPLRTYLQWKTDRVLPVERDDLADDADYDGISNLLEFALGLDPVAIDFGGLPVVEKPEGEAFRFRYARSKEAKNVDYVVQTCVNLNDWTGEEVEAEKVGETEDTEIWEAVIPADSEARFVRLEVVNDN
jgi:hypothetical protein